MPWTVTTDPNSTWTGRCSQSDIDLSVIIPDSTPTTGAYMLDGFEDNSSLTNLWAIGAGGVSYSTTVRGGAKTGAYSCKVVQSKNVSRAPAVWPTTLYARVYFMINNVGGSGTEEHYIVMTRDGGVGHHLVVAEIGATTFRLGVTMSSHPTTYLPGTFAYNTWYRLSLILTNPTSPAAKTITMVVYEGDSTTPIGTVTDSAATSGPPLSFYLGDTVSGSRTFDIYYDDIAWRLDELPGPGGIFLGYPSSTSQGEWTPSTGLTNYGTIDDFPGPVGTDYNSTSVNDNRDLFGFSWASPAPTSEKKMYQSEVCGGWQIPTSTANIRMLLRTSQGVYLGSSFQVDTSSDRFLNGEADRSLTQIWSGVSKSELDASYRIGYEKISGSGTPRISVLWVNFDMR